MNAKAKCKMNMTKMKKVAQLATQNKKHSILHFVL